MCIITLPVTPRGIEYFAGYKFPINQYAVKSIQPYFMGDRLEYVNGRNYQRIDNGLGISFQLDYGFRVDYEHVFTSSTDNLGDMNWSVYATTSKRSQLPGRARLPWLQIAPTGSPAKAFTPQAGTIEHAITSPAGLRPPASCREREFSRLFSPN